jgi:hypothetical protein
MWTQVWRNSHMIIERDDTTGEERITYADPAQDTRRQQAASAITANKAFIGDASVTQAEAVAQVKALSRQVNALIRATIDGTD